MPDAGESRQGGRDETFDEKMDRNWAELLQELRVLQTGVQILAGFLLTLPFQSRFETLDGFELVLYLAKVALAGVALLSVGTSALVFDVVAGRAAGLTAGGALLAILLALLVLIPNRLRRK